MITHTRIVAELKPGDILMNPCRAVVVSMELANVGNAWIVTQRLDMANAPLPLRQLRPLTDRVVIAEQPDEVRILAQALLKVRLRIKSTTCHTIIDEALFKVGVI